MKTGDLIIKLQTLVANFPKAADREIVSEAGDYGHMDINDVYLEVGADAKVIIETGL